MADGGVGLKERIKAHKMSLFCALCSTGWSGDGKFWNQIFTNRKEKTTPKSRQSAAFEKRIKEQPFAESLNKIKDVVQSEFIGSFPIAKLNFFALYAFCTEVLIEVSRKFTAPGAMPVSMIPYNLELAVDCAAGFSFVACSFDVIQIFLDRNQSVAGHRALLLMKKALITVSEGKTASDFLWKSL
ncbi:uncharacterized protein BDZ99DRAFT_121971 [Mytilinidion resinicola]|uniref:Uncharacterized protein n=1 Tax=Mytilinidion resinicola TaxID=574789 RepID=A0A6A6Z3W4_9PEZI|nr:uncharacterized protein BDZ99DRAFT_121971 [Mytilinidion resinicola]KAF2815766.1 hypothetical protein BDZ99DRAFT_121971 [Mytilinidion resinicola]